jgi:hypothetical protein
VRAAVKFQRERENHGEHVRWAAEANVQMQAHMHESFVPRGEGPKEQRALSALDFDRCVRVSGNSCRYLTHERRALHTITSE